MVTLVTRLPPPAARFHRSRRPGNPHEGHKVCPQRRPTLDLLRHKLVLDFSGATCYNTHQPINRIRSGIEVVITALTRNQVYRQRYRGFESHPLRHNQRDAFGRLFDCGIGICAGGIRKGRRRQPSQTVRWTVCEPAGESHPLRQSENPVMEVTGFLRCSPTFSFQYSSGKQRIVYTHQTFTLKDTVLSDIINPANRGFMD